MCLLREKGVHSYNIEGRYLKTGIGRMVWIVWNRLWGSHGGIDRYALYAFSGGGQGSLGLASDTDRSIGRWYHGLYFFSLGELKGVSRWWENNQ